MDMVLNYIFIGFIITFLLDYVSDKYKNHPSWVNVPEWDWGSRIMFILFWPLGAIIFVYAFLGSYFKK